MSREDKKFVVQKHTHQGSVHWDFMLEKQDFLQTYRLDKSPEQILQKGAKAEQIFDHSLKFLTYQGPVNQGRGSVSIVESGTYQVGKESDNLIELHLTGQILKGKFIIQHLAENNWRLYIENPRP